MLQLKEGYKVPFPEKLYEGFEVYDNSIIANVNADKLEDVIQHFIVLQGGHLFFIHELPADSEQETKRRATKEELQKMQEDGIVPREITGIMTTSHKHIYYVDGCSVEEALVLFERVKKLLLADGMCQFGFGCHESNDEIMVKKYNVVTIYSENIHQYEDFFEPHEISKTDNLITAWDTFSASYPGTAEQIKKDEKTVYDIPELLKEWGIYLAETVEE